MTYNLISSWKETYGYWKLENGSLTCFEHQSNITVVVLLHKSLLQQLSVFQMNGVLIKLQYVFTKLQHLVSSLF